MRRQLLPQKPSTAIQVKLQLVKQNEQMVADYGIVRTFLDLAISLTEGNCASYEILNPIKEKYAIKRFVDGLRNRWLSAIIAARNFDSLKDDIQTV